MKKIWCLLALLTLAYPGISMGDDQTEELVSDNLPPVIEKKSEETNSFSLVGANYSRANIKPNGLPSFNGNLGGLHAMYEYQPANAFYVAVEFAWRQGSTNGSDGKRTLTDLNMAESLGYTWVLDKWLGTFFTGFGFRFLGHHLKPSDQPPSTFRGSFFPPFITDETSLKLEYYEFYFPLGFVSEYTFSSWFTLGLSLTWMPQAFSTVQIRPLGGAYWTLTNTFGNFLVEMPFIFNLTKCNCFALVLNPFYERWQDGHSTAKTSNGTPLGLPGNTYNFWGADVNFIYSF